MAAVRGQALPGRVHASKSPVLTSCMAATQFP